MADLVASLGGRGVPSGFGRLGFASINVGQSVQHLLYIRYYIRVGGDDWG